MDNQAPSAGAFGFLSARGLLVVALVAALFRGTGPAPAAPVATPPQPPAPQVAGRAPATAAPTPSDGVKRPAYDRGSRLLEEFFGDSLPTDPCRGDGCDRLDVVIATVPDPADTRLDLNHDVAVEALRLAHERAGFVIDRFWLPPSGDVRVARVTNAAPAATPRDSAKPAPSPAPPVADSVTLPRRRVEPGVLLFRHRNAEERQLRLLYLVGEVPTSGVHRLALANALAERAWLLSGGLASDAARDTVRVVGPVFSGSAPSLRRGLDGWLAGSGDTARPRVTVVSGSATSPENATTLSDPGRIGFQATINSDAALDAALGDLLGRLEIDSSRVAVLHEGTTQYGGRFADQFGGSSADTAGSGFLMVPFPMNIAALRRETPGPSGAPATDPRFLVGQSAESRVTLSLGDTARSWESPRMVSNLTPAATELVLDEIISTLQQRDIRLVGLQGSDVRDKLFLAEQIRRRMRDVRFYTYESNVLYLRGDRNSSLRGMVVFSSYPLVLSNQWWTGSTRERMAFSSDAAQGIYNATLTQLGVRDGLLEYQVPFSRSGRSDGLPVWTSVVGTRHFLPLRVDTVARGAYPRADAGAAREAVEYRRAGGAASAASAILLALAVLAAAGVAVRTALQPSPAHRAQHERAAAPRVRSSVRRRTAVTAGVGSAVPAQTQLYMAGAGVVRDVGAGAPTAGAAGAAGSAPPLPWYRRIGQPETPGLYFQVISGSLLLHRQVYTWMRLLALGGGAAPVFLLLWKAAADRSWWLGGAAVVALAAWLTAFVFVVRTFATLLRRYGGAGLAYALRKGWWQTVDGWLWMAEAVGRAMVVAVGVAFLGMVGWLLWEVGALGSRDDAPFALFVHRALQLGSGVSPLVPILAATAGFTLWATWHLQRVELLMRPNAFEYACLTRVDAGASEEDPSPQARIASAVADLRDRLFLMVPHWKALWLGGALGVLVVWLLPQFSPTLEASVLHSGVGGWLGINSFDVLLRFSVCATLVSTAWAVYRMLAIWHALQRILTTLEETPLTRALDKDRLPPYVARVTRLTLLGTPRHALKALVTERLDRLRTLYRTHAAAVESCIRAGAERRPGRNPAGLETESAHLSFMTDDGSWEGRADIWCSDHPGRQFLPVCAAMESLWEVEDVPATIPDAKAAAGVARWLAAAEDFVAAQVVDYLDAVLQQFRRLAIFLFVSLLLTTLLISGYPFPSQSLVKLVFLAVLAATVASLLLVMTQMNTDATLSRLAGTQGGRITWDTQFVLNALLVAVVPILALLSSEYPALRAVVVTWVKPLYTSLAGG